MMFNKIGTTILVSPQSTSFPKFLQDLQEGYLEIDNANVIIDLESFSDLVAENLHDFLGLSEQHLNAGKSFVLVSDKVPYDDVPDAINLAPTVQEAHDIIEMEEIERDLGI